MTKGDLPLQPMEVVDDIEEVQDASNLPEMLNEDSLPSVNGQQITVKQWKAFMCFLANDGHTVNSAEAAGIDRTTLWKWRKEPWWDWLAKHYILDQQQRARLMLATKMQTAIGTLEHILTSTNADDKTLGAKGNAVRMVLEAFDDPIIKKTPTLQNIQNIFNNHGTINIAKLKGLPPERLHEIATTLEIPDDVKDFK